MSGWLEALRAECERTSQRAAAERLGVSASMVNQVLGGNYKADSRRLEERVRGELMDETVECPVLGDITKRVCQDHQQRPCAANNPTHIRLYRACRNGCPNSTSKEHR